MDSIGRHEATCGSCQKIVLPLSATNLQFRHVITSFLHSDLGILLLRRSGKVGTYQGRWAGVSGYLEPSEDPLQRANIEIREELGISAAQVSLVRSGEVLRDFDEENDTVWIVHPFLFEMHEQNIRLDWEHTEYEWVNPDDLRLYETIPKLREALERVRWDPQATSSGLSILESSVNEIARDRVHGASYLGRKSIEILAHVARVSTASSTAELFRDLLSFVLKLRRAQPSMATIRNLTGKVLKEVDEARTNPRPVDQFRENVRAIAEKVQADAVDGAEDASRTSVGLLPEDGRVLTHSYSGTVKRALELAAKSKHRLTVYVTESIPGLEGRQLANDLIKLGIPVKLIADFAVGAVIADIDLLLVGADSVLADGSVVNKIGTSTIAKAANERGIPCFVACEEAKFSTQHFLGEPVEVSQTLFDVTPTKRISAIVTEEGPIEPVQVEKTIRKMLSQLYP